MGQADMNPLTITHRAFFLLLLLSCASCQRGSGGEGRRGREKAPVSFGGFEPIGKGKGLRFPGEKRGPHLEESTTPAPEFADYYQYSDSDYPDYYYYYQEEEPLPSGPTQEPPLPSGPTRRPGQPTSAPHRRPSVPPIHPALNQFLNLPLLTTQRPRSNRKGNNRRPKAGLDLGQRPGEGPLRVHSSLDIVDQTALFTSMDPHQEQFIPPPRLNAGALPLAFESDLPLNQFPPFRPKSP